MKAGREYMDYLKDILDAIEKVDQFTEGMDFEKFSIDHKTIFAVIRALEIIGEASKKIPEVIKLQNPGLPWREMAGIRDKLVHEYFGTSYKLVWNTAKEDIPKLKPGISALLNKLEPPNL
jgi:uncharacterized protein with HEPN domain